MFTGVIRMTGRVYSVARRGSSRELTLEFEPPLEEDIDTGDSLSVDGCCLTVTQRDRELLSFDVVPATAERTTLGELQEDDVVNLETSLRLGDKVEGHLVQGHVDGVGEVLDLSGESGSGEERTLRVDLPGAVSRYVWPRASVAVNGVSLTVQELEADGEVAAIALVPHTLDLTNLSGLEAGDRVNLEADQFARGTVEAVEKIIGGAPVALTDRQET